MRMMAKSTGKSLSSIIGFPVDERVFKPLEDAQIQEKRNLLKSTSVSNSMIFTGRSEEERMDGDLDPGNGLDRCLDYNMEVKHIADMCQEFGEHRCLVPEYSEIGHTLPLQSLS